MAEIVVDFVCQKLQDALNGPVRDALIQEGLSLYGVNDKAGAVKQELERIRSFLRDADSKSSSEERAEVDWINYKEPGFINSMKRFFKKPMLLPALYTLGGKMDDVQASIIEITKSRLTVGVTSLDDGSSGKSKPPIRRLILPDIGEMEMELQLTNHTWLENLIGLRHLEFRECELENDTLPEKIDCLHCLEYLDLTDTKIVDLPKSINEALNIVERHKLNFKPMSKL
ncbi:putative disease resistance protein [Carex littledalei]|uniref:Putative disease resistance protein n=1 Tax=Carex littledalei TaxID=544730 RepID=A0A833VB40_9POAL|nr:putative disease resistance protein [Carex littledalei]